MFAHPRLLRTLASIALTLIFTACSAPTPGPSATSAPPPSPAATSVVGAPQSASPIASPAAASTMPAPSPSPVALGQPSPSVPAEPAQPPAVATGCTSPAVPTLAQTEGPYFTPNAPLRGTLVEPGMSGDRLTVEGFVLSTACQPVASARVDVWQADANGAYDNAGFRLRGHQLTDDQGRYRFETILPGLYPGRTRHIHVKVQPPNRPVLTTQLYFPNEPANASDSIFRPALLVTLATPTQATFNFIVG